jgi:predicted MFS family arabinose efflux permease
VRTYRDILADRRFAVLLATALVSRLPITINGLAVVLFVRAEIGSFSVAGAAAGALALGTAIGAPLMGRLVDRHGVRLLWPLAAGHAAGLVAIVALGEARAPAPALLAAAVTAGALYPPNPSVLRARLPELLRARPHLLTAAFALDSVLLEVSFVVGPLLTAALVALIVPAAALLVSAAIVVVGTLLFTLALPPAEPRPARRRDALGALRSPGIRTLVLTMLPVGFAMGAFEVVLPAFADREGSRELAGVLLACWSLGSVAGGLAYGARAWATGIGSLHLAFTLALPVAFVPTLAAASAPAMALLVLPAGALIAPIIATRNELAATVAPRGAQTEALTWPLTALVAGVSLGAAAAGSLADALGWRAGVLAAIAAAALGGLVAAARRRTLLEAEAARRPAPVAPTDEPAHASLRTPGG